MIWMIAGFLLTLDAPIQANHPVDICPECRADRTSIESMIQALQTATRSRERIQATDALGSVRWQCHPEAVAALAEALHEDKKSKVRGAAAGALRTMVPNLAISHVALDAASRSDPESSVRKQAKRALAAKGLRCVEDCPICGPIPKNSAITGPSVLLPEWRERRGKPDESKPAPSLPPALPEPTP